MAISFQPAEPMNPGIDYAYGQAQQQNIDMPRFLQQDNMLIDAYGQAARMQQQDRHFYDQMADSQDRDRFEAEKQYGLQNNSARLQGELMQTELTAKEKVRLSQLQDAKVSVMSNPKLSEQEKSDMVVQLDTGINPLAARDHAARTKFQEAQVKNWEDDNKRQTEMETARAKHRARTIPERMWTDPETGDKYTTDDAGNVSLFKTTPPAKEEKVTPPKPFDWKGALEGANKKLHTFEKERNDRFFKEQGYYPTPLTPEEKQVHIDEYIAAAEALHEKHTPAAGSPSAPRGPMPGSGGSPAAPGGVVSGTPTGDSPAPSGTGTTAPAAPPVYEGPGGDVSLAEDAPKAYAPLAPEPAKWSEHEKNTIANLTDRRKKMEELRNIGLRVGLEAAQATGEMEKIVREYGADGSKWPTLVSREMKRLNGVVQVGESKVKERADAEGKAKEESAKAAAYYDERGLPKRRPGTKDYDVNSLKEQEIAAILKIRKKHPNFSPRTPGIIINPDTGERLVY